MLKRPFKSLIARIAIVALALSLVVPFVPAAFGQDGADTVEYPENGTEVVRTFTLSDQDDSGGAWSVSGDDAGDFEISSDGALSFKNSPNYESPADKDGDNTYNVTVSRSGGSLDVVVTVTNVDEPGSVTINDLQPQAGAGQSISADISDPDGDTVTTAWQWSRSMDQAEWEDIVGATSSTYSPRSGDDGYYLRATATYSDGLGSGRDSASAETEFPVELRPAANTQPSFEGQDDTGAEVDDNPDLEGVQDNVVAKRMVRETAKAGSSIGNPVVATDADNDPVLYTLTGVAPTFTTSPADTTPPNSKDVFAVDGKTGQLSVKGSADLDWLDFETYATTNADANANPPAVRALVYTVTVTATDPSGATADARVQISVTAVDEAPDIARDDNLEADDAGTTPITGDDFVVETDEENPFDPDTIGSSVTTTTGLPIFTATDPEGANDKILWSVSGVDANRFDIVNIRDEDAENATAAEIAGSPGRAALRFAGDPPSFEAMDSANGDNVYVVVVRASDGSSSSSKTLSVTVNNIEEDGKITLSQREPQQGIAITARLTDPDGNISGTQWQWFKSETEGATLPAAPEAGAVETDYYCTETDGTARAVDATDSCAIRGATSSTYIPKKADAGTHLTAVASYVDGFVTDRLGGTGTNPTDADDPANPDDADDGDTASAESENGAVERPTANDLPSFLDDDPASRSVDENAKGASVGDPVTATDEQPLLYTLSGDGSDAFKVDGSGQISTAEKLDYETQPSYTITVTATDPSLASASIMVNITVNDTDDNAVISAGTSIPYEENGTGPVQTFVLSDQDASSGGWSRSGDDAGDFEISSDGALSFKNSPNYESPADKDGDNTYNVTVSRSGGSLDVVVTVTNVDEAGTVTINDLQPQAGAGQSISADISDPDGDTVTTAWQWSRSMDQAEWEDIVGATSSTYTPKSGDAGYYLRAGATYSDGLGSGRDSASAETVFPVELRPAANTQPSFEGQDDTGAEVDDNPDLEGVQDNVVAKRMVRETAKAGSSIGNPVVATDADNDPVLYTLTGVAPTFTTSPADTTPPNSKDVFAVDGKTGQLSVKGSADLDWLDFETYATTNADANANPPAVRALVYTVTVTATDPSGATADARVQISVTAVDEAPDIARDDNLEADDAGATPITGDDFVVETDEENPFDPDTIGSSVTTTTGLPIFTATDPEGANDKILWSVSGVDANRFDIVNIRDEDAENATAAEIAGSPGRAALRFAGDPPSFEAMDSANGDNVYVVVVRASDGSSSSSKTLSVTVNNIEEDGKITLSQREPQQGIAITARLTDPDGNISGTQWQWFKSETEGATLPAAPEAGAVETDYYCTETDGTARAVDATDSCAIRGATSSTYIPKKADAGTHLTAVASYVDGFVTDRLGGTGTNPTDADDPANPDDADDGDTASVESENGAVERPTANDLPSFLDDDPASRSVDENAKGASVGDPVTATDEQPLLYTLSGDGSDAFKVDGSGQISTAEKLDYETQSSYAIMVTATDPSLANSSITVNITVNDTDDNAVIVPSTENSAPAFASESVSVSVDENAEAGTPVGDPITATDKDGQEISYSLDDDSVVEVWPSGQLTVAEGANLDYESGAAYTVILTASDGIGGASIEVTVNVNNVGLDNGYDTDDNGEISKDEAIAAVDDYFLDNITRDEVNGILALYFG